MVRVRKFFASNKDLTSHAHTNNPFRLIFTTSIFFFNGGTKMVKEKFSKQEKEDRAEAKRDMKMWLANDYELVEETPEFFLMKKNTATGWGHFWILILIGWWTLFIPNIIYHFASVKKKKIIK